MDTKPKQNIPVIVLPNADDTTTDKEDENDRLMSMNNNNSNNHYNNHGKKRSVTLDLSPTINITDGHGPARPRQSSVSRASIEVFLNNFPKSETAYANADLKNVVSDIMHSDIGISKEMSLMQKVRQVLQSNKFHLVMMVLVALDCVCVVVQVILDIIHSKKKSIKTLESVVELLSCFILGLFIVEIILKTFLLTKHFFKSKLELFDAAIVIISFSLEILSIVRHDQVHAIEAAVITFRFWRVVRIANGVILTIEKRVYHKLSKLKEDIKALLEENNQLESENKEVIIENRSTKTQLIDRFDEVEILKQKVRELSQENKQVKAELYGRERDIDKVELAAKLRIKELDYDHLRYKLEMEQKLNELTKNKSQ